MMEIKVTMCYSQLMTMLLCPKEFTQAVIEYTATAPDIANEGFTGYMETKATFKVKDVTLFAKLYEKSYTFPSDRSEWYYKVRDGVVFK